jgi:hypothetical protein
MSDLAVTEMTALSGGKVYAYFLHMCIVHLLVNMQN